MSHAPSAWVSRHAGLIPITGQVLDLAAGSGRHSRYFKELGYSVLAVDRDISRLSEIPGIEIIEADLETPAGWPLGERRFAGIVVTNYLHRPLFPALVRALLPDGVLIYDTFASGNERFGRPSNPAFLLRPGELLEIARDAGLVVRAYEHGEVGEPHPAVIQRIAAQKPASS